MIYGTILDHNKAELTTGYPGPPLSSVHFLASRRDVLSADFPGLNEMFDPSWQEADPVKLRDRIKDWCDTISVAPTDPLPQVKLVNEYAKWPALSVMQKAVRRSHIEWATPAIAALINSGHRDMLVKRMAVVCVEDLGLTGLLPLAMLTLMQEEKGQELRECDSDLIINIAQLMCFLHKDRSCQELTSGFYHKPDGFTEMALKMPADYGYLSSILMSAEQPPLARVMATRTLVKHKKAKSVKEGAFSWLGLPDILKYVLDVYPNQHDDPLWIAYPTLWSLAEHSKTLEIVENQIPETPIIHGIPACCLDMFSSAGKKARTKFKTSCAPIRQFFKDRPNLPYEEALDFAIFAAEGGRLSSHVEFDGKPELSLVTLEDEFRYVHMGLEEAAELTGLVHDNLDQLHEHRKNTVTGPLFVGV